MNVAPSPVAFIYFFAGSQTLPDTTGRGVPVGSVLATALLGFLPFLGFLPIPHTVPHPLDEALMYFLV